MRRVFPRKLWLCIFLSEQPLPANVPPTLTLREAFTRYLDINAVPRRSFFNLLRHFATEELEREKLDEFCTPEGQVSISFLVLVLQE